MSAARRNPAAPDRDRLIADARALYGALKETSNALHAACLVIRDPEARDIAMQMVRHARGVLARVSA